MTITSTIKKIINYSLLGSLTYNIIYDINLLYKQPFDIISNNNKFRTKYIINHGLFYGGLIAFFSCYYNKPLKSLLPFFSKNNINTI